MTEVIEVIENTEFEAVEAVEEVATVESEPEAPVAEEAAEFNADEAEEPVVETEAAVVEEATSQDYAALEQSYQELQANYSALEQEVIGLREYKATQERKDKQTMIDSFYMLSDEDKQNVVDNIDTYSLNEIEAELSIICVRNKVNFNLDTEEAEPITSFNLNAADIEIEDAPAWVKAVKGNM